MRTLLAAATMTLLGACATPPAPLPATPDEATAQDACGASRFRGLIGRPASEIDRAALPPGARVILPDMMVTMDFVPQRLNIIVGTDGRVGSLRCF